MTDPNRQLLEARIAALTRLIDSHAVANGLTASEVLTALAVYSISLIVGPVLEGDATRDDALIVLASYRAQLAAGVHTSLARIQAIEDGSGTKH